jgi:hypothetical protein
MSFENKKMLPKKLQSIKSKITDEVKSQLPALHAK